MALKTTIQQPRRREGDERELDLVTKEDGIALLDRQARRYFGMSGKAFAHQYRSGAFRHADQSKVKRVALLIPFAED